MVRVVASRASCLLIALVLLAFSCGRIAYATSEYDSFSTQNQNLSSDSTGNKMNIDYRHWKLNPDFDEDSTLLEPRQVAIKDPYPTEQEIESYIVEIDGFEYVAYELTPRDIPINPTGMALITYYYIEEGSPDIEIARDDIAQTNENYLDGSAYTGHIYDPVSESPDEEADDYEGNSPDLQTSNGSQQYSGNQPSATMASSNETRSEAKSDIPSTAEQQNLTTTILLRVLAIILLLIVGIGAGKVYFNRKEKR